MNDPIILVDYDPNWPTLFEQEKARLIATIGSHIVQIEHIGSTAVPGLAAKPIIDILVGVRQLADATPCVRPLVQELGYQYVPEFEIDIPERRYFRRGMPRTHQIHLVETDSAFWRRHLAFRDYLRTHPADVDAYAELKQALAIRYRDDRAGYTDAKSHFIQAIEAKAT